jgi:large subunit ribosomal protein L10
MDNPRLEKVAVVDEVRTRLGDAHATVVTEYRGLTVADLAALRKSLIAAGGDYKVFKNTLVKRAIDGGPYAPLEELLVGPTAIAFVRGDVSAVAKALRDFGRTNTHLVVKGGMLDGSLLSPAQLGALADLPSREVLLARLAGGFQAPLAQLASLLQALPRNLAYGLKALLDERGGAPAGEGSEVPVAAAPETEQVGTTEVAAAPAAASPAEQPVADGAATGEAESATSESEAAAPDAGSEVVAPEAGIAASDASDATAAEAPPPETTASDVEREETAEGE